MSRAGLLMRRVFFKDLDKVPALLPVHTWHQLSNPPDVTMLLPSTAALILWPRTLLLPWICLQIPSLPVCHAPGPYSATATLQCLLILPGLCHKRPQTTSSSCSHCSLVHLTFMECFKEPFFKGIFETTSNLALIKHSSQHRHLLNVLVTKSQMVSAEWLVFLK